MKAIRARRSIIWMVRLLGAPGLLIEAVMTGQIGLQLKSMRTKRVRLQEHLNQAAQQYSTVLVQE